MEGFAGETEEERVAIIQTGGDKAVNKDRGGVGGEGGAETINIAYMEVGRPGDVIDVRLK